MLAASSLCLLAACQDGPPAAPPAAGGIVLLAARWESAVHPAPFVMETVWMEPAPGSAVSLVSSAEGVVVELPGVTLFY